MPDNVRGASEAFHKSMEEFHESMEAGDPVPSVAEDVKRWWNARRQILNYLSGIKGCKVEGTVGIDLESLRKQNPSLQFDYPTPPALFRCGVLWASAAAFHGVSPLSTAKSVSAFLIS